MAKRPPMFGSRDLEVTMRWGYALVKQVGNPRTAIAEPVLTDSTITFNILSWSDTYDGALETLIATVMSQDDDDEGEEPPVENHLLNTIAAPLAIMRDAYRKLVHP